MTNKRFLKGAAILGLSGIVVKLLGAAFKIPLGNIVSETTMAYYAPSYYVYSFFIVIATAGIPLAVSKLVAENLVVDRHKEAYRIFRCSLVLLSAIGILSFIIVFFGADYIADFLHVPNAKVPMQLISPALLIFPVMSAYRGYFQGMQVMGPTAASQVVEQVFRVTSGLILATIFFRKGGFLPFSLEIMGAGGALLGDVIGSTMAFALVLYIYIKRHSEIKHPILLDSHKSSPYKTIYKDILVIAIPITLSGLLLVVMNLVDSPIINNRLIYSGYSISKATEYYGIYSGYIASIITLPQALTVALSISLLPHIAAINKSNNTGSLKNNCTFAIRISLLIGLPCAFGIGVLARPVMMLLYPAKPYLAEESATCLMVLAAGTVFLAVIQTSSSILQAIGKPMLPVWSLVIGVVLKIVISYILVGYSPINIKGAAAGTVIALLTVALLNIVLVKKHLGVKLPVGVTFIRPLISSILMCASILLTYFIFSKIVGNELMGNAISTLFSMGVGLLAYALSVINVRAVSLEEMTKITSKPRLQRIFHYLNFRRELY